MHARRILVAMVVSGCGLQPPPAVEPEPPATEHATPLVEQPAEDATASKDASGEPKPQSDDSAKLEMMMAEPDCVVEVVAVLKSARGFWSDPKKNTCTYEVVINGQRYKYTRQLPRDRRAEPDEICEKGLETTDSAVRDATHECKDLKANERPVTGLVPIR